MKIAVYNKLRSFKERLTAEENERGGDGWPTFLQLNRLIYVYRNL